jgi:hypothetical protein
MGRPGNRDASIYGRLGLGSCSAVLALLQTACLSPLRHWEDQRVAPAEVVEQHRPAVLRVTKVDSTRLVVREPRVADGTLLGVAGDSAVSLPLAEIARVAVRRRGASPPVQLGAAVVGVGLLIYIVTWDPP